MAEEEEVVLGSEMWGRKLKVKQTRELQMNRCLNSGTLISFRTNGAHQTQIDCLGVAFKL